MKSQIRLKLCDRKVWINYLVIYHHTFEKLPYEISLCLNTDRARVGTRFNRILLFFWWTKGHASFLTAAIHVYESLTYMEALYPLLRRFCIVFVIFIFIIDLGAACLSECQGADHLRNVFFYETRVYCHISKNLQHDLNPSEQNQFHIFASYICKAHIYTILLSSYRFPEWSLSPEFPFRNLFTGDSGGVEALGWGEGLNAATNKIRGRRPIW
jgi:hypothetical protein